MGRLVPKDLHHETRGKFIAASTHLHLISPELLTLGSARTSLPAQATGYSTPMVTGNDSSLSTTAHRSFFTLKFGWTVSHLHKQKARVILALEA